MFWFDGAEQEHRYELYNLKDDIGETRNLAEKYPGGVQKLAAKMDSIRSGAGALAVHPNTNYNGRTVGVWSAHPNGKATAEAGVLIMRAINDHFPVTTRVTPSLVGGAALEFEARSATKSTVLSVQWTSSEQPRFAEPQLKGVPLSKNWKTIKVDMPFGGRIMQLKLALLAAGWEADIRNVHLLTPDGTVILKYEFY